VGRTNLRSYLYVPGDRADLLGKALASGTHGLILDLEDGVAPANKKEARRQVLAALNDRETTVDGPPLIVRVDPHGADADADLEVAVGGGADAIVLAKSTRSTLDHVDAALRRLEHHHEGRPVPVIALIESARGLLDAAVMAEHQRVDGLAIGEADLGAELGVDPGIDGIAMAPYRATIVVASAAAGLRRPTGPASTDFRDLDALLRSCEHLRRQGFGARSAIHPAQVAVINEAFAPTQIEIERARATVAAFDAGVAEGRGVQLGDDGTMLDEAVIRAARRVLDDR